MLGARIQITVLGHPCFKSKNLSAPFICLPGEVSISKSKSKSKSLSNEFLYLKYIYIEMQPIFAAAEIKIY